MTSIDFELLAEKAAAVERHLDRVERYLPPDEANFVPSSTESDAVILHLWQATQIAIDVAMAACLRLNLGTPSSYADAFRRLGQANVLDGELVSRLARASGFRNRVAHAYESLDLAKVYEIARTGPPDLRAFLLAIRGTVAGP